MIVSSSPVKKVARLRTTFYGPFLAFYEKSLTERSVRDFCGEDENRKPSTRRLHSAKPGTFHCAVGGTSIPSLSKGLKTGLSKI